MGTVKGPTGFVKAIADFVVSKIRTGKAAEAGRALKLRGKKVEDAINKSLEK